jgi:two-component system KDP operon response regulator KdpE
MKDMLALVVDDDPIIRKLVRTNLEQRGYSVRESFSGSSAIAEMEYRVPDLVILDLIIPDLGGSDICQWIRERWEIPIIVMSARSEEDMKVQALDAGADDFITKPFGQAELMARIRAVMRRADYGQTFERGEEIAVEGLRINLKARRAFVDGRDIRLTRTEFALLAHLAQNPNIIFTHDELLAQVWGEEYVGSSHYLHVYFGRIRKKIGGRYSPLLESVSGIGYILHTNIRQ